MIPIAIRGSALVLGSALVTACGGLQPIGAQGALPQSRAIATHAEHGGSWTLSGATISTDYKIVGPLLYVTNYTNNVVKVYPAVAKDPRPIASITSDTFAPTGDCLDSQGTLYVTNEPPCNGGWVSEYPLGKTNSPQLTPKIVKAREFKLPGKHLATFSIIVGPDKNLWFTEFRGFGRFTVAGHLSESILHESQPDPGTLTMDSGGYVWANSAEMAPPAGQLSSSHPDTSYLIYRLTSNLEHTSFALPANTDVMPTNLLNFGSRSYFGFQELRYRHRNEHPSPLVASIDDEDSIETAFRVRTNLQSFLPWIDILKMPGDKVWLYDYHGNVRICRLSGACHFVRVAYPAEDVDNLHPMLIAYSPANHEVYIANRNDWTIYRLSSDGKRLSRYVNTAIQQSNAALVYYRGDMYVALNGDAAGRPILGRFTRSNQFSEFALPFKGPTYEISALVPGPDGHLWYLRGNHVGEIVSGL